MSKAVKRGTRTTFQTNSTKTEAPRPKIEETIPIEPIKPPSYGFVNKQTGEKDKTAEEHDIKDEEIREGQGKDEKSDEQPKTKFTNPKKKVFKNEKSDQPHTERTEITQEFEMFWARETDYDLESVICGGANSWTPNAIAMFEILEASHQFVANNRVIEKKHPEFLGYGVAIYYSILFYIQILRAKEAAGHIFGDESSFLRRFRRTYPDESLPVTRILMPYFSTIVSTLMEDSKYDWIIPDFAKGILTTTMARFATEHDDNSKGGIYIQPMVPFMLKILHDMIQRDRVTNLSQMMNSINNADDANTPRYFNDLEEYVPQRISGNADFNFAGLILRQESNTDNYRNTIFWSCGVRYPVHATGRQIRAAAPKWRTSSFRRLNNAGLNDGARAINSIDNFLLMEKNSNLEWFEELIMQATTHARFFGKVYNLSNVPTSGGLETVITARYKKQGAAAFDFTDMRMGDATLAVGARKLDDFQDRLDDIEFGGHGNTDHTDPWYPETFRNMVASFYTTRNGFLRQEVLQAMTFGTNGTLFVGAHDGANRNRVGEDSEHYRIGDYWKNKEWSATKFEDADQLGKEMFKGWKVMIQTHAAMEVPEGYYH